MKNIKFILTIVFIVSSTNAWAWGQTGHRVTGQIAQIYLSEAALAEIKALYPNSSLAEISTHADEQRSNPSTFWQKTASPWHYVTVPAGKTYKEVGAPPQGDAMTALSRFATVLKDPKASVEEKRLALHFSVHIIGDLHQPLHAGNGTDKGGNDRKVNFFWENSNLHRVWDSGLIDRQKLSFTEWTTWLDAKISPEQKDLWQQATAEQWIKESTALRDQLYPEGDEISWNYQYEHLPTIKLRLQQAGIRIAAWLNDIYNKD